MKLTKPQEALLLRKSIYTSEKEIILLMTAADDRVARSLQDKGLCVFYGFKHLYPWGKRDGYVNHIVLTDEGFRVREGLRDGRP